MGGSRGNYKDDNGVKSESGERGSIGLYNDYCLCRWYIFSQRLINQFYMHKDAKLQSV